ncbi:hypothetical protein I79_002926 [Cricetulus griseus]|uniref:Uncharacterized protein n=1 Tax=Cricetulus griseus TaxID=10029 RepID=G3GYU7_CRIGR|nr:hypothetical protein I79_002926 [Cricetulus griseus]
MQSGTHRQTSEKSRGVGYIEGSYRPSDCFTNRLLRVPSPSYTVFDGPVDR